MLILTYSPNYGTYNLTYLDQGSTKSYGTETLMRVARNSAPHNHLAELQNYWQQAVHRILSAFCICRIGSSVRPE